jgi:DNA-binding response OmpR family regulator
MLHCALIIDDEEDICILLSTYLRKKNFDAHYSMTLQDGLKKLKELHPSILFLDNNLPDGSGIDTVPEIRDLYPQLKIIIISAMTTLKERAFANSADAFIDKPISFDNIQQLIW